MLPDVASPIGPRPALDGGSPVDCNSAGAHGRGVPAPVPRLLERGEGDESRDGLRCIAQGGPARGGGMTRPATSALPQTGQCVQRVVGLCMPPVALSFP